MTPKLIQISYCEAINESAANNAKILPSLRNDMLENGIVSIIFLDSCLPFCPGGLFTSNSSFIEHYIFYDPSS